MTSKFIPNVKVQKSKHINIDGNIVNDVSDTLQNVNNDVDEALKLFKKLKKIKKKLINDDCSCSIFNENTALDELIIRNVQELSLIIKFRSETHERKLKDVKKFMRGLF